MNTKRIIQIIPMLLIPVCSVLAAVPHSPRDYSGHWETPNWDGESGISVIELRIHADQDGFIAEWRPPRKPARVIVGSMRSGRLIAEDFSAVMVDEGFLLVELRESDRRAQHVQMTFYRP